MNGLLVPGVFTPERVTALRVDPYEHQRTCHSRADVEIITRFNSQEFS